MPEPAATDDMTDLLIALVTAHRTGMAAHELGQLLRDGITGMASTSEEVPHLLSQLIGHFVGQFVAVLGMWDQAAGQPVADRWIATIVEIAAEHRG